MMPFLLRDPGAVGDSVSALTATCPGVGRPAPDSMTGSTDWRGTAGAASVSTRVVARDGASAGVSARAIAGFCFASSVGRGLGVVSSGTLGARGRDGVAATAGVSALGSSPTTDALADALSATLGDVVARTGSASGGCCDSARSADGEIGATPVSTAGEIGVSRIPATGASGTCADAGAAGSVSRRVSATARAATREEDCVARAELFEAGDAGCRVGVVSACIVSFWSSWSISVGGSAAKISRLGMSEGRPASTRMSAPRTRM